MTSKWLLSSYYRFLLWIFLSCFIILIPAHASMTQTTPTLRLGVLPDSDPQIIKQRLSPLLHYIEAQMEQTIELIIPKSYEDLLQKFQDKSVDLALFGGYTFISAQQEYQAEALVIRDIDLQFCTAFITQADNPKQSIADFKSAKFSFGAKLSTSGHMMPRYFLNELNFNPETFFSDVHYSGAHDKTIYWVRDGQIDLGAVNYEVLENMLRDGLLHENEIHIVWKTPTYTDYVWATQPDFNEVLRDHLLDIFLSLSLENDKQRVILESLGASGFLPTNNEDFEALRKAAKIMPQ